MKKNKKLTRKQVRRKYVKKGAKMTHLNRVKRAAGESDEFLDENSKVIVEDAFVSQPSFDEVRQVVHDLDGFRDWEREARGNNLTYGDY
jgi:hypothetical protein